MSALDDTTFDRLLNIQSYNDAALKDLVKRLSEEERELSKKRRLLHGEIDIVRAELVRRLRDKHAAGEKVVTETDLTALTEILAGHRPLEAAEKELSASAGAAQTGEAAARPIGHPEAAQDVRKRFGDWSVSVRDERYVRHIIGQLRQGRRLDDILSDTYMMAHTSEAKRSELMQNPQIIEAVQDQIEKQFAQYGTGRRPGSEKPQSE
jgi:hypothetical protein